MFRSDTCLIVKFVIERAASVCILYCPPFIGVDGWKMRPIHNISSILWCNYRSFFRTNKFNVQTASRCIEKRVTILYWWPNKIYNESAVYCVWLSYQRCFLVLVATYIWILPSLTISQFPRLHIFFTTGALSH